MPARRRTNRSPDWDAIQRDYRTGKFSSRELAIKYDITHSSITRRAMLENWSKDLRGLVREATDAALMREALRKAKARAQGVYDTLAGEKLPSDAVLEVAEVNRQVVEGHRSQLLKMRTLADEQAAEVMSIGRASVRIGAEALAAAAAAAGLTQEEMAAAVDAATLVTRVTMLDKLASAISKLQPLERKAHKLDMDDDEKVKTFEDWLRENPIIAPAAPAPAEVEDAE